MQSRDELPSHPLGILLQRQKCAKALSSEVAFGNAVAVWLELSYKPTCTLVMIAHLASLPRCFSGFVQRWGWGGHTHRPGRDHQNGRGIFRLDQITEQPSLLKTLISPRSHPCSLTLRAFKLTNTSLTRRPPSCCSILRSPFQRRPTAFAAAAWRRQCVICANDFELLALPKRNELHVPDRWHHVLLLVVLTGNSINSTRLMKLNIPRSIA